MAQQQSDPRTIEFPSGRELTGADARSGAYVFAAGPDPRTYAFRAGKDGKRLIEEWAESQGLRELLERLREAVTESAGAPGADFDAERTPVAEDTRRLEALTTDLGQPKGAPEVLGIAHRRGILNTAYLYPYPWFQPRYGAVRVEYSTPDLTPRLPYGAQSCQTTDEAAVALYQEVGYGPNPYLPLHQYFHPRTTWERTAAPIFSIALRK